MKQNISITAQQSNKWNANIDKGSVSIKKVQYGVCLADKKERSTMHRQPCWYIRTVADKATNKTMGVPIHSPGASIPTNQKLLFSQYCDAWLAVRKTTCKQSTYCKYQSMLMRYILPYFGKQSPLHFNNTQIAAYTQELLHEKHLAPKTVKDILIVLRSILHYTAKQFPDNLPALDIVFPKESKKELRVLTKEEQSKLTAYLLQDMDACKFGVLLAMFTGIRLGELCALKWEHISFSENTVHIVATLQRLPNVMDTASENFTEQKEAPLRAHKTKVVIDTPKSETSLRVIPLTEMLITLCNKMYNKQNDTYILTNTKQYMEPRTLQYRFQKYLAACNLSDVHFHTLRHTFATRCVEAGFEIKSLSEILGHATTTITLNRYVHASLELKRENMNKLSAMQFGADIQWQEK